MTANSNQFEFTESTLHFRLESESDRVMATETLACFHEKTLKLMAMNSPLSLCVGF